MNFVMFKIMLVRDRRCITIPFIIGNTLFDFADILEKADNVREPPGDREAITRNSCF